MLLLSACCAFALAAEPHPVVTFSRKAKFEDVRDDLKTAASQAALKEVEALLDGIARTSPGMK